MPTVDTNFGPIESGKDWGTTNLMYYVPQQEKNLNKTNLYKALLAAEQEIKNPTKNAKNPFLKNLYVDLNAVIEATKEILLKNGIIVMFSSNWKDDVVNVVTSFIHVESGDREDVNIALAVKEKTSQGFAGAVTYGKRYGLMSGLNLTGEDDDDGNTASGKSNDFASQLKAKAKKEE
jgi:hypothetical protein